MAPLLLNLFILLSYPLNFFIYCAMSRQFRDAFRELCCLCCGVATAPADLGTSVGGRPGDREPRGRTSAGAEEPRRRGGPETRLASWDPSRLHGTSWRPGTPTGVPKTSRRFGSRPQASSVPSVVRLGFWRSVDLLALRDPGGRPGNLGERLGDPDWHTCDRSSSTRELRLASFSKTSFWRVLGTRVGDTTRPLLAFPGPRLA